MMKKEYDFSNAEQGKFYRPNKVQKTIRLDSDIIEYFQHLADQRKIGYQTLINQSLRDSMEHPHGTVDLTDLRKELRTIVRTEIRQVKSA
jgi:uncharacterized protein (DUF4415 family)